MRKRMIAWLLCLCVTLTAAPELLLASVPAESVTAEQTTELAETELAETNESESIQTEAAEPESTESESIETEESGATEVTEETEATEVTEETEDTEEGTETEVTETSETEVTEAAETEDTEEQETENTETEEIETETEEVDLTDDMRNASSGDEITRIAWVQELVTLFELSVEEDNYPDNYYSDISTDDSYYRDIMVACEFGMIDLEAGEAFCPENAVTREFAVQSLNAMLGFVLDSETYTYSDTADVTYQDDAQIAVNRGWVTLTDGAFLPEQPITTQEHDAMIADATQVLADAQIDTGTQNSCSFTSNVVVVPEGTEVSLDGEGNITIENCPVSITAGTTFAVYADGIAMAYKAESVQTVGTTTYIKATDAEDGAVLNVNQQGEIEVDLTEFVPADEETYVTNGIEVTESKTRGISYDGKTLKADKTISLADNVTATVNIVISDIKVSYSLKNNDYYFSVSGDLEYSCNVKGDLFADIDHTLTIGAVPLGDIGMLTLALEYSLSGEATLTVEKEFEAGFAYSNGFRVIGQSQKKSFSFAAEANFSTGVILSAKASLGVVSGGVDAKAGARLNMKAVNYSSGKPSQCISQASYLYASVGANAKIGIGILSRTFEKRLDIWDVNNSPIRVYYHYEDGVLCTKCTRGKEFASKGGWTSYYTSPSSRYFNPAGVGSYVDATGATVPLYTYTLDDSNKATITGYNGSATALYLPSEIDGYEVTTIGESAFENNTELKTVLIPDSVTEIDKYAFANCSNLSNVVLSKNLEYLGAMAFGDCTKITQVEIPKSLDGCGSSLYDYGPFGSCTGLKKVTFENGTTEISRFLFEKCTGLEEIVIPETVTVIEDSAFSGCTNLKKVNIPDSVTKLEEYAFYGCTNIANMAIPDSVTEIDKYAFANCSNLSNVVLSKNLEYLGAMAFGDCTKITQVEIPKSLDGCGSSLYDYGPFGSCTGLKKVTFENGTTEISRFLFEKCTGLEEVVIPGTVTVIENSAFSGCTNLKTVSIPKGMKEIENYAFYGCTSLTKVTIPDTVTDMGTSVFSNCTSLVEVHLPNVRENITASTFYNCKKLTTVNFPSTLKAIRQNAFYGCESLTQAVLPTGLETIEGNAFYGCKSLKKVVTPDTITSIGNSAFYGCEALTDVTLGSGLKAINSQTFYGCTVLPSIVIPYNVASIGDSAFVNCTKLTSVTVPRKTTSIASNAFSYPKKMTMYGPSGCYAQDYAAQKGIKFVKQDIHATSVTLNVTNKTVDRYEDFQLTATIAPNNFTDEVVWTSSNEDVATVSENGYVETYEGGTAVITVTVGGKKASCNVTVRQLVNWMDFEEYEVSLKAGQTHQLSLEISPSNATDKRVDYVSSNPSVATVSASGLVTAKAKGETKITATAKDGSGEYAYCYITVTGSVKPSGISLDQTSAKVKKGKTLTLKATVTPGNATNKKVTWKSSNTKIATVDAKGVVTAKAPGKVTITATAAGNTSCKATCSITVPYNIVYKLDKGKNNSKNPDSYYNQKIALKNPSRKGYEFKGWYTDSKFKNKITTISKDAKKDYTLYAKWAKVKVGKATLSSAKNNKSKQILVKYKKVSGAKGYEISYSTDKNFKKGVTAKTTDKTSYTIKKLKAKKTYYVRVRAYKVDSAGKKVYGKYSSVKKVKISK